MKVIVLSILMLTSPAPTDDFVPVNVAHASLVGCTVAGRNESPPYAEAQVFVNWGEKDWFKPILSRREVGEGGVLKAIDDCRDWLEAVKKRIQATKAEEKPSK